MTTRVIEYLSSFLPPRSGRPGIDGIGRGDLVLRDYESLAPDRKQDAARALTQLWDAFIEHFGGIEGFLTGDELRRRDYIQRVETAARRMRDAKGSEKGHYFFATALLAHYLHILHDSAAEDDDQRVASRIVSLIDLGRKLVLPTPNEELESAH